MQRASARVTTGTAEAALTDRSTLEDIMASFLYSPRVAVRLLALAFTLGLAGFGGPAAAAPGGAVAVQSGALIDASPDGFLVLAKNDDRGDRDPHRRRKGKKNWSKNDDWNNGKNWNKHNGRKYGWGDYGDGWNDRGHGWNGNWNRGYVGEWYRKPYYGEFIGGIILGSLLAADGYGLSPYPPAPGLCWYWADPYMYRGYWDYCD
jgi:hypothetical protein